MEVPRRLEEAVEEREGFRNRVWARAFASSHLYQHVKGSMYSGTLHRSSSA